MSLDLDWCMNGCGKRCQLGSLYCSSYCLHSAHSQCDHSTQDVSHAFESLSLGHHTNSTHSHCSSTLGATSNTLPVSPALSATSSTGTLSPPSPMLLAANITQNSSYSLEFRNRSYTHGNKRHHLHSQQPVPYFVL
ncbi:expressed protein [Batrachochytrium dendrobatidis JAM81]|uniref:Expressed protein n=2 Tax=Batrachochytrium dendrobatidis TaxID=109871 RepID=F4PB42_BATDJ|nr:uncharacterized protein BATDEDRAFT_37405 [Batrachochytrium dendrobatidis JAM81]EGF77788.1 expressed protein [Batrachochytrium dendrobatidis JAM81]KAJ8323733.1 hypothetical protein O5D80_007622 [Batrachochytrium dendrobatidis]KAK5666347.1 hypothetical protein QVD99_007104 [Batrachochytrium dendrobatidis]OAJ43090.1 hypothetical protein BDEG_26474 [Batrachochytrium dendrobatidis JEL423]|eukprot:XP_006681749.1 expressed protein [Batrachochytrium dendrobatidis JAM81]